MFTLTMRFTLPKDTAHLPGAPGAAYLDRGKAYVPAAVTTSRSAG
jgi:hypothetical protein